MSRKKQPIRMMQEEYFKHQQMAINAFEDTHQEVVKTDYLGLPMFWDAARAGFQVPRYDLLVPDEVLIAEQMSYNAVEPLSERAKRDGFDLSLYEPESLAPFTRDGVVYAIPYVSMCNMLVYRRDILQKYDMAVPTTFEELRTAALEAQSRLRADGDADTVGFVARGFGGYGHNFSIVGSTLLASWGWPMPQEGERPVIDTPEAIAAFEFYVGLLADCGPAGAQHMSFPETQKTYASGKAVFYIDQATEYTNMPDDIRGRSGVTTVPTGPTGKIEPGLYSPAYCIPANSDRKDRAWQLLLWLLDDQHARDHVFKHGFSEPSRADLLQEAAFDKKFGKEIADVIRRSRKAASITRPCIRYGYDLGNIIGLAAQYAIAGDVSPREAIRWAQDRIDDIQWA